MRRTARLLPPALALLLLTACTTPSPMPTVPPSTDADPVFASDEEALAAAEEAYGNYLDTVAAVLGDGGANAERLKPLLTTDLYEREAPGYDEFKKNGWRGVGVVTFSMTPQSIDSFKGDLVTYVCEDRSEVDIVDSSGTSIVPADRPIRAASQVTFIWKGQLLIANQESWDGGGVCD